MNVRNKKRLILTATLLLFAATFVFYFHFLRKPSHVVSGPAALESTFSHTAGAQAVEFSPTGDTLASGSIDGSVKISRQGDGQSIRKLKHPAGVTSLAYSPDSNYLATGSYDSLMRLWRVSDGLAGAMGGEND